MNQPSHSSLPLVVIITAMVIALWTPHAGAADVHISLATREVDAGAPFTLSVEVTYDRDLEEPSLPEMVGIQVLNSGTPSRHTMEQNLNGRVTRSITFNYSLLAPNPGTFTIPPITVTADGRTFGSAPIPVQVRKTDAGELLIAEIEVERNSIFLGEAVDLTLRLWVKPFYSDRFDLEVSDDDMWSLISLQQSNWGVFRESLQQMLDRRRQIPSRRVQRTAEPGAGELYYQYTIQGKFWPRTTGQLDLTPPMIAMRYPVRLGRSRDIFRRGQIGIEEDRTIRAQALMPQLEVLSLPKEGKPAYFTGAVGNYVIRATAQPRSVAVGDPITLTLTVLDKTSGGSQPELLQAPALDRIAELTRDFRIPADPLAGVVSGRSKRFTQTIRARSDEVTAIPSIPLAFFDPAEEVYRVVRSEPIPIEVEPAAVLSMSDVVGATPVDDARTTELTEVAGGLLANQAGSHLLRSSAPFTPGWQHLLIVVAPPVLYVVLLVGQRRIARGRTDPASIRRRRAKRNAMSRIRFAGSVDALRKAEQIELAMNDYVADRCGLPNGALARGDVINQLQQQRVKEGVVSEVEALLEECEGLRYGGNSSRGENSIVERATRCIAHLERERLR